METLQTVNEMQAYTAKLKHAGESIALVPTMGCLHEGHLSLIRLAKQQASRVVVSIFVNPTQFGPNEDFDRYPRRMEADLAACAAEGVDAVFNPSSEEIYPKGYSTFVNEEVISSGLCGVSRPNHFRGVTTICTKLFIIIQPDIAVFGQKDAQQTAVLKKLVRDLCLPVTIVIGPTLRDEDGLAMSSRNRNLTPSQRQDALSISRALKIGTEMVEKNVRSVDRIVAEITHHISHSRRVRLIYVQVVDRETMEPAKTIIPGTQVICLAAWVDEVRLIDNALL